MRAPMFLALLTVTACSPSSREQPEVSTAASPDVMQSTREAHEAYVAAINANDSDALMRNSTSDVTLLPPHEMAIAGKAAARSWAEAYFKASKPVWEKHTLEFVVSGEWAFEQYSYKSTATPLAGGKPVVDVGKGITVYRLDADGKWRVARDAWNSDQAILEKAK